MYVKRLSDFMNRDEGSGLLLALMTLMVLSLLGASLGAITYGSYKLGDVNRDDNSAYYIAEAGANMAYEELEKGVLEVYAESEEGNFFNKVTSLADKVVEKINLNEDKFYEFEPQFGDDPTVTVAINEVDGSNPVSYEIVSTGEVAGKTRSVIKPVEVTWIDKTPKNKNLPLLSEKAVMVAKDNIIFENSLSNSTINGDIHIDALTSGGLETKSKDNIIGTVYFHPDANTNQVTNGPKPELSVNRKFPIPWNTYMNLVDFTIHNDLYNKDYDSLPRNLFSTDEVSLDRDFMTDTLMLTGNKSINTSGKEINLVVDKLIFGWGNKELKDDSKVNIFVREEIVFQGGGIKVNEKNPHSNLKIFYSSNKKLILGSNNNFLNASIVVKNAPIEINGTSSVLNKGIILTGGESVKFINDAFFEGVMIAPRATVTVEQSSNFSGQLVAEKIYARNSGNMTFNYNGDYFEDFPFGSSGSNGGSGSGASLDDIISSKPAIE